MRILMVSMNSIHFQRWTNQLKDSGHEIFWFDIKDGATVPRLSWVTAFQDWKFKFPNLKGRHWLKKHLPKVHKILENDTAQAFEKVLLEVKPDVVHSFVLQIACLPILNVMNKHSSIKWIYSAWGSDLYNKTNKPNYDTEVNNVLTRVNYLFTDCKRDFEIAKVNGFNGLFLGVYPGGGGYKINEFKDDILPIENRNIILVKGYQGALGRCIEVLKAIQLLNKKLKAYKIVVFGADEEVINFVYASKLEAEVLPKSNLISNREILKLMEKTYIYIGNSISDGMPNTLLESIIMGAFPIQSNPGNATAEIIINEKNGLLINDSLDVKKISALILNAISNPEMVTNAFHYNQKEIKPKLEYKKIKNQVLYAYNSVCKK